MLAITPVANTVSAGIFQLTPAYEQLKKENRDLRKVTSTIIKMMYVMQADLVTWHERPEKNQMIEELKQSLHPYLNENDLKEIDQLAKELDLKPAPAKQ